MTDESTTNNVNNVYGHELFIFLPVLTLPERQLIFLYKTKIHNGKIN